MELLNNWIKKCNFISKERKCSKISRCFWFMYFTSKSIKNRDKTRIKSNILSHSRLKRRSKVAFTSCGPCTTCLASRLSSTSPQDQRSFWGSQRCGTKRKRWLILPRLELRLSGFQGFSTGSRSDPRIDAVKSFFLLWQFERSSAFCFKNAQTQTKEGAHC